MKLGYSPYLTKILKSDEDIDILFYGAINERRRSVLNELQSAGYNVCVVDGINKIAIGTELDILIARSKLILNMHYYEDSIFEVVRVSYLLSNMKAVVCEVNTETEIEESILDGIIPASRCNLFAACDRLLKNDIMRKGFERSGFEVWSRRIQSNYLLDVIKMKKKYPTKLPNIINLGSGKSFIGNALNIDINEYWQPDIVADLSNPNSIEHAYKSRRFGEVFLTSDYFNEIVANNVLEHVAKLSELMLNCLKLLKVGGVMKITVPYDLSYGAWQDPTHVRSFNERSWWYYTDWYWYMGWTDYRFKTNSLTFILSEYGQRLQSDGLNIDDILRMPRSIDSMAVELEKIELNTAEKIYVQQYLARE